MGAIRRFWGAPWSLTAAVFAFGFGGAAGAGGLAQPGFEERSFVCAQVVLAIDGSRSTQERAFQRQIAGIRAAFERERLYHAIQDCLPGSVGFAAITWSGPDQQEQCVDWSLVTNRDQGRAFATRIDRCGYVGGTTDIGRAVEFGLSVLEGSPLTSYYRIIFLLTNGRTDQTAGSVLAAARAQASAAGVTLAGYALLRPTPGQPSPFYVPDAVQLDRYVAEHVSAGPRAFTAYSEPADDVESLLRALAEMLRQEAG